MEPRELLDNAFVLHTRPYRETSLLVELLTRKSGRFSLLGKGIKRSSATRFLLQPFIPLLVAWRGKGELPVLTKAEMDGQPILLKSTALLSALYLNELLMRILHRHDPCEETFNLYFNALKELSQAEVNADNTFPQQVVLRNFEQKLLIKVGYALPLSYEFNSNQVIQEDAYYRFAPEHGFIRADHSINQPSAPLLFLGKHIIQMAQNNYQEEETLHAAKRITRLALARLLGSKPLKSRELFKV